MLQVTHHLEWAAGMKCDGRNWEGIDIAVAEVAFVVEEVDSYLAGLGKVALVVVGSIGHELLELVEEMREGEHSVARLQRE